MYNARMGLQVFGTRKDPDTRKAERYLRERGVAFQFIDLAEKGIAPGELRVLARAAGKEAGFAAGLIDSEGVRFKERGLGYMDFDPEEEILKDPLLLRTPILRDGKRAAIGFEPKGWDAFLGSLK
jgi:arsenate reductase-like glutaredoxin family protein